MLKSKNIGHIEKIILGRLFETRRNNVKSFWKVRYPVKKWISNILWHIKIATSFPHVWICATILILAGLSLWASYDLTYCGNSFWSSVFANIFAGLITGFVICLISGVKQITIIKMQEKKAWLENLAHLLKEYFSEYHQLRKMRFDKFSGDEKMFDFIYDVGSHANWINEEILQSSFNKTLSFKPLKYSKKFLGYDALALCNAYEELHGNLQSIDVDCPSSKEIIKYFDDVHPELKKLSSGIYASLRDINARLSEIQKTII